MSADDRFPPGWDEARVQRLLEVSPDPTDLEALAEAAAVHVDLVPV